MSTDDVPIREQVPGERTLVTDALLGAAVTVVLSFVPFSPVLGGAAAGYLHEERGPRVGGLSGLFASVPVAMFLVLALLVLGFGMVVPAGADGAAFFAFFLVFVVLGALFVAGFNVVLGAAGGVLGVALAEREQRKRRGVGPRSAPVGAPRTDDDAP